MQEERNKLKENLLNKKRPGIVGFENSQPLQATSEAKIKRQFLGKRSHAGHSQKHSKKTKRRIAAKSFAKISERAKAVTQRNFEASTKLKGTVSVVSETVVERALF